MSRAWSTRGREQVAGQWVARIRTSGLEQRENDEWVAWMDADPENREAYERAEMAWEVADELHGRPKVAALLRELDSAVVRRNSAASHRKVFARVPSWTVGVAAASLFIVTVLTAWIVRSRVATVEYNTAVGAHESFTLADDSVITLNSGTRVRVSYSRADRVVTIHSGEALFEVAKDASRPFSVRASGGITTAVGTKFDVRVLESGAAVDVLEGIVEVGVDKVSGAPAHTRVSAGQAVSYAGAGTLTALRRADTNRILGWQQGRLVLSDVTLAAALADYNRYVTMPIVVEDSELADRHISGVFRIGEPVAFLRALEQALPLRAVRRDADVLLEPR